MANNRIVWADMLKGFCMLAILWFHTEMYYAGQDMIPYELYVEDVLAIFFFLAGYVTRTDSRKNCKRMLQSVFRWLFVPYLLFTCLLAIPKALVHRTFDGVWPIAANILSGHASWFISSLIVAKLLYIFITFLFKPTPKVLAVSSVSALFLLVLMENAGFPWFFESDFWCINEALLGFSLMVSGMLFRRYENRILPRLYSLRGFTTLFALAVITKYIVLSTGAKMVFGPVMVSNFPLFLFDLAVCILLFVGIFMKLPYFSTLEYVGRRSIVYYFFCGGCPLLVSTCLNGIGFNYTYYAQLPVAYALVVGFLSALAFMVYRYTNIVHKV